VDIWELLSLRAASKIAKKNLPRVILAQLRDFEQAARDVPTPADDPEIPLFMKDLESTCFEGCMNDQWRAKS
jgi:hypothetical protein